MEGYGRKKYKNDFVKFLIYSHSGNDETVNHLEKLKVLYPGLGDDISELAEQYHASGGKIDNFKEYVTSHWRL
ncbi:four helix bundle protein [Sinomicrobium pectinilyticum]|uniref:four helix bundle protein n=1 Tax=Sinomicrobium pectinilyticum TaxID=1084421 RepID=UPI001F0C90B8